MHKYVVGITSTGDPDCDRRNAFVKISYYIDWIKKKLPSGSEMYIDEDEMVTKYYLVNSNNYKK